MWKQTIEAYELLDAATVNGEAVAATLRARGLEVQVRHVEGERGATDVLRISVPGTRGRTTGGDAPTLGVIGQLGGIGARPARIGLVSDADGAITAVAVALKLADMRRAGDLLPGDVIVTTHICPQAPTRPHHPVPFMDSPVGIDRLVRLAVDPAMEAILSIDTTRGNRVVNSRGIAISPTVKEGYLLRVSEDLLDLLQAVTGRLPVVLPLTTQDITPYGNDIFHLNSIAQPATVTTAPVVGVALTTEVAVPGPATGA
ncbi:MAG: DUF1177 domain-containing protein, partial [Armatimonadota bacterium]|nr:DUF1177 domain-containing protein [Armatimonadota bacterium]